MITDHYIRGLTFETILKISIWWAPKYGKINPVKPMYFRPFIGVIPSYTVVYPIYNDGFSGAHLVDTIGVASSTKADENQQTLEEIRGVDKESCKKIIRKNAGSWVHLNHKITHMLHV